MPEFNWPKGYQNDVENILGESFTDDGRLKLSFEYDTVPEARLALKNLRFIQKQLRQVIKSVNQDMRLIRAKYKAERESISDSGTLTGLFLGKRFAGRERQRKKTGLAQLQKNELIPYENVKNTIDQILLQIEGAKLEMENFIAKEPR